MCGERLNHIVTVSVHMGDTIPPQECSCSKCDFDQGSLQVAHAKLLCVVIYGMREVPILWLGFSTKWKPQLTFLTEGINRK